MKLELEYACTVAEIKEAQKLYLRKKSGVDSSWGRWLKSIAVWVILAAAGYFYLGRNTDDPKQRWMFVIYIVVFYGAFWILKRAARQKSDVGTRLEVSEQEVVFAADGGRVVIPWSGLSRCLESPDLFVLVNRTKTVLYTIPKRAFSDEGTLDWFRTLAAVAVGGVTMAVNTSAPRAEPLDKPIAINGELKFIDYLNRHCVSWRIKGMVLIVFGIITGIFLLQLINPPAEAVNSPTKVYFVFMLPMMAVMLAIIISITLFLSYRVRGERHAWRRYVLTGDGFNFTTQDSSGHLPWSNYRYYTENRWSFFIWNPQRALWLMFPKRHFASSAEIELCRELLQANLKKSRWFL